MGYIRHHAIIVTGNYGEYLQKAHAAAKEIFPNTSPISRFGMNKSQTFLIPPDGSKDGWEDSNVGDRRRARFIEYLESTQYEDGSSHLKWVEVMYGDDEGEAAIIRHDADKYTPDE